MNSQPSETIERHVLYCYSFSDSVFLKDVRDNFSDFQTRRTEGHCLTISLAERELIFIFQFGSVAFLNVPEEQHDALLERIGVVSKGTRIQTLNEEFIEDDFEIFVGGDKQRIAFNSVTIQEWDEDLLRITAQVLSQSGSLSLVESEVEEMVAGSEKLTAALTGGTSFSFFRRKKLLEFLGGTLEARHCIVNQILILKDPEIIWECEEAHALYMMLLDNFEFGRRVEAIEKMLALTFTTSELHFNLFNARHSELLEIVIILLIAVEIIQTFFGH